MRRIICLSIAAIGLVCFAPSVATADITYTLDDYPGLESGYHVAGSITTDGTLGTWTTDHITSWAFTISNSSGTVVSMSTAQTQATIQSFTAGVMAASSLYVVAETPGGFTLAADPNDNANRVGYLPPTDPQRFFGNEGGGAILWDAPITTGTTFEIGSAPVAVPEPATHILALVVGLGGLVGVRLTRGRRSAAPRPTGCPPADA